MTVVTSKVCVVGDFAVGKTSVVERFVNNQFSEKYLTTVGVKIDTKEIRHAASDVDHKLVIWDVAGSDRFGATEFAYLRAASGYIFVADGTRSLTLSAVRDLHQQIADKYGTAPSVVLVNKKDLSDQWELSEERIGELAGHIGDVYQTSAKLGDDVDVALKRLAELIIDSDLQIA